MGSNISLQSANCEDHSFQNKQNTIKNNISSSYDEEIEVLTDALDPLFPVVILEKKRNTKKTD